tara:strand:- start:216 stop:1442 length:1227 start_codon:yes stop_codon:yes gene_type:complete
MTSKFRRVVITGFGVISAIGNSSDQFQKSLFDGECGIRRIKNIPTDELKIKIAAEVNDFIPEEHFSNERNPLLDRFSQFALAASRQAVHQSQVVVDQSIATRAATIIGTGIGGLGTQDDAFRALYAEGTKRLHPFVIPRVMGSAAPSNISIDLGLQGPTFTISSACASATHAIGESFEMIRRGRADIAITGGAEACITFGCMKAWEAMRVMSTDSCRPFSADRDGMVLGEGAAIFVLEALDIALKRDACILAEISGFGMSADASGIVQPSAIGAARAMRLALEDAHLESEQIDYINAHGTGTVSNDKSETQAIRQVFEKSADRIAVSSTKGAHGHALGASGALELAATILAIKCSQSPPTINYRLPDPDCDLDYVPNKARTMPIEYALTNSFAFGGLNAVLVIRHPPR